MVAVLNEPEQLCRCRELCDEPTRCVEQVAGAGRPLAGLLDHTKPVLHVPGDPANDASPAQANLRLIGATQATESLRPR